MKPNHLTEALRLAIACTCIVAPSPQPEPSSIFFLAPRAIAHPSGRA